MYGILTNIEYLTFQKGYFEAFGALTWKGIGWSCLCIFQQNKHKRGIRCYGISVFCNNIVFSLF
jgi:hypothetical protein